MLYLYSVVVLLFPILKSGFANTSHVRKETLSRELRLEGMIFLSLLPSTSYYLIREVGRNITSSVVVTTNTSLDQFLTLFQLVVVSWRRSFYLWKRDDLY